MGVSSAMDWWDEWKLRVLVLCSLFVQFFLSFSQHIRRLYILRRMRVVVWIAYMGGDALAIYALATLFNRQKQHQTTTTTNALQVIWAPVLLIHLGGHWNISAYSLEDNELWRRHVVTLVSQVTVALYVFCKWWSGETRLLQAAVLLFVVGIIRFSEKPWALRKASFRTLVASTAKSSSSSPPRSDEASIVRALCSCTFFMEVMEGFGEEDNTDADADSSSSLEEYVAKAQEHVKEGPTRASRDGDGAHHQLQSSGGVPMNIITQKKMPVNHIRKMFLDVPSPYSARLHHLRTFLKFDEQYQHIVLERWILMQFSRITFAYSTTE